MKTFLAGAIAALTVSSLAFAQPAAEFDALVEDYQAFTEARDVVQRGRDGDLEAAAIWPDISFSAVAAYDERMEDFLARLNDIEAEALDERTRESYAVLEYILESAVALPDSVQAMTPFTNDSGFQSEAGFVAMSERPRTVEQAEAWIGRIEALPAHLEQYRLWLERGIVRGWTQPKEILPGVAAQLEAQIVEDPAESVLLDPIENLPPTVPVEERARLRAEAIEAIAGHALPAYRGLADFFRTEYMPAGREELGISSVPGGRDWYEALVRHHTTLPLTPEQVHQTGRSEVARIRAEMDEVIAQSGFEGSFEEFLVFLRTDPQFYAGTEDELLMHAAWLAKQADDQMPAFFNTLPRLPYGVRKVPDSIAPNYTTGRYWGGDMEEGRAGGYMVNTYRLDQRPLYELPALTLHEAVPGHHHQISLAQEMDGVPEFRTENYITAFGEGWGLYAERLGLDMGLYKTPYDHFGRLTYEMWRACRLVADTGIHWYGWSRDEAEACFLENTALSELNIENEVSRYISWPGQALAYKTGELLIREMRTEAEAALGEDFDLAEFHDTVLESGALPLVYLEQKLRAWIEAEQAGR